MELTVYKRTGADAGRTASFDDEVYGIEPNDHVIWLDVKALQAHKRQGTHKTKERSETAYSRRKLYRQKGTGNARAGDRRSPIRVGGGTIFGPRPHEYRVGVSKKTRRLARRSALAYKLQADALKVVEDFTMEVPKTREIAEMLSALDLTGQKVLILTDAAAVGIVRSARNIPKVTVRPAAEASTLDLMDAHVVLLLEGALEGLTTAVRPNRSLAEAEAAE